MTFKKYCLDDPSESTNEMRAVLVQAEVPKLLASSTRLPAGKTASESRQYNRTQKPEHQFTFNHSLIDSEIAANVRYDIFDTTLSFCHCIPS